MVLEFEAVVLVYTLELVVVPDGVGRAVVIELLTVV